MTKAGLELCKLSVTGMFRRFGSVKSVVNVLRIATELNSAGPRN